MRKIGLIGGLSWVSTAEYYRRLNEITQERLGGVHSAHLLLESIDRQDYVDAVVERRDETAACRMILDAARSLEAGGASFVVICCNDVHRFVPEIEPEIGIPFLHIADATAKAILEAGFAKVALMGVRKTMEEPFYPERLARHGIEALIPEPAERDFIHNSIYEELVRNVFREETRRHYAALIEGFRDRGAEGTVLGCTEIPLLIDERHVDVPLFATTELHCQAAVETALGERDPGG